MPKLKKFHLSKKNIVLLLIIYSVPIVILAYPNFSQQTRTEIKILDKQTYLEKYKDKDPIEDPNIDKDNIIFESKTDINNFLKENKISNNSNQFIANQLIVDYYHEKYKNKSLSYIYFEEEDNTLKKVLLFWEKNKIKNEKNESMIEPILLGKLKIEEIKEIYKISYFFYKRNYPNENDDFNDKLLPITNKSLYYQNKKILSIYLGPNINKESIQEVKKITNMEKYINNLSRFSKSTNKIYIFAYDEEEYTGLRKLLWERDKLNKQKQKQK